MLSGIKDVIPLLVHTLDTLYLHPEEVQLVIVMPAASMRDEMIAAVIDASGGCTDLSSDRHVDAEALVSCSSGSCVKVFISPSECFTLHVASFPGGCSRFGPGCRVWTAQQLERRQFASWARLSEDLNRLLGASVLRSDTSPCIHGFV
ncbi:hypothetical protein GBF38_011984 [Nibea albiflora]|uniref:Uncharacterized protein n=1 Tax=Nibea albiflora TaxID=240163 RepID=A0ACB7EHU5_NIBAL|nr:hypothetical protein GBF38_011984 [Nibea albiflora]